MIINHRQFELNGKNLIEKFVVKAPLRQSPVFRDEACFIYVKEGMAVVDSPKEQVKVESGESVLLKCGTYFAEIVNRIDDAVCEVFVIHLYPEILKEIYQDEIPEFITASNRPYYTRKMAGSKVIEAFVQSLDFYFDNREVVSVELLRLKLKELVLLLLETNDKETIIDLFDHLFTPQKASIAEVVNAHLYSNITLEQMARLSGHSLSTFKRLFREHFNNTPANYIREQRMKKAAGLLGASGLSVSEISFQLGYKDSAHFSRLFSQHFNMSPSDYIQLHKKQR